MGMLESLPTAASVLLASQIWKKLNTSSNVFIADWSQQQPLQVLGLLAQKLQHEIQ